MNYQTAAIVAGAAFVLSAVAGMMGSVPFLSLLLRAVFWAAVGFGLSLGVETLLRNLLPDLFTGEAPPPEEAAERRVDITVEDEKPGSVFEEVDEEEPETRRRAAPVPAAEAPVSAPASAEAPSPGQEQPQADEEMPEIGSFLDAFKANDPEEGEEEAAPEYAEYAPEEPSPRQSKGVTIDGEEQDPVILAKAIQTVMKRDGQGN